MNYTRVNKEHWDASALIHINAPKGYYDIAGFNSGKSSLKRVHVEELGDVCGKKILHLLCHIGLDTLSLARLGAKVVGVDISEKSIEIARSLAEKNNISARFICSDVYGILELLKEDFDIVFASHGVVCWLEDLNRFMGIVEHYLRPGGFFYLMEGHPMSIIMSNEPDGTEIKVTQSYFKASGEPIYCESSEDYADKDILIEAPTYEWKFTLSDIINSVCNKNLNLIFLHEFPYCDDSYYMNMEQGEDGWWRFKQGDIIPLMFSIKAVKTPKFRGSL